LVLRSSISERLIFGFDEVCERPAEAGGIEGESEAGGIECESEAGIEEF